MDIDKALTSEHFKKLFWKWFDSLSTKEREKFQTYPVDMAEIFYYNKHYRHLRLDSSTE